MKNKNTVTAFVLFALFVCAQTAFSQTYNSESDFVVERDGYGITITGYRGTKTAVNIPPRIQNLPVTGIGKNAFRGNDKITSVTIPDRVTSIGDGAFWNCGLTNVTIGNSVTVIGRNAFCNTSLTSVTIPDNLTEIGEGAFCAGQLAEINVSSGNSAYILENGVLYNKDKTTLILYPPRKTGSSFIIPISVTSIGDYAFRGCTSLTNVTIPDSVTSIGESAFGDCTGLTNITIPAGVTSIEGGAFGGDSLTAINVAAGNSAYTSEDGVLYNKNKTTLIQYPAGKTGSSFTIPDSVTSIGSSAFGGTSLTSITIPNSVTSIGDYAFCYCRSLTSVTFEPTSKVTSIGESAFSDCTGLTSVIIPDSVTGIGRLAFAYCTSLASVTIGNGVTRIMDNVFFWCTRLTSVTFGSTIAPGNFSSDDSFPGDLRDKYLAGGKGTYTRPNGNSRTWTKK